MCWIFKFHQKETEKRELKLKTDHQTHNLHLLYSFPNLQYLLICPQSICISRQTKHPIYRYHTAHRVATRAKISSLSHSRTIPHYQTNYQPVKYAKYIEQARARPDIINRDIIYRRRCFVNANYIPTRSPSLL